MIADTSKVTVHMVTSLDGFVAKLDNDISWLQGTDHYEAGAEWSEEQVSAFLDSIDCYILGSRTYEHVLEVGWPYGDKPVVVASKRQLPVERTNVSVFSGDLRALVQNDLRAKYKNIWMVGGPQLAKEFLRLRLVDQLVLSIRPVILGEGVPFLNQGGQQQHLLLEDYITFKDGMVELTYTIKNPI